MKKRCFQLFILILMVAACFSANSLGFGFADGDYVYLGGMPCGFALETRGAHVIGLCDVVGKDGVYSPAKNAGVNVGDVLLKIDQDNVNTAEEIEAALKKTGKAAVLTVLRGGEKILLEIVPAVDVAGDKKLGLFVRSAVNGIGTITYLDQSLRYGALGHPVLNDDGNLLDIVGGKAYGCSITGFVKGEKGTPGELRGIFLRDQAIGTIDQNLRSGVYGTMIRENGFELKKIPIARVGAAKIGEAKIYTTIDGVTPKEYRISIVKVDKGNPDNKNLVIKITDKTLLAETGGILQGMSGSPIVQGETLIGAVTHVFVNDPTRGFGILIENMLGN